MKWFKHDCDMHTDLKIQSLIARHGLEGYAIWNLCLEMVGKEGKDGRIVSKLSWLQGLLKVTSWSDEGRLEKIISSMADLGLICKKSFKYGHLYIPKFKKRADDYTMRKVRTMSEQTTDKVLLDKIIDKIRIEKNIDPSLNNLLYQRYGRAAKQLATMAKNDSDLACRAIAWVAGWCKEKGYSWELETVNKHFLSGLSVDFKQKPKEGFYQP